MPKEIKKIDEYECRFLVTKFAWGRKYDRILGFQKQLLCTLNPKDGSITNSWLYKTIKIFTKDPEDEHGIVLTVGDAKPKSFRFKCTFREEVLAAYNTISIAFGNRKKPLSFEVLKLSRSAFLGQTDFSLGGTKPCTLSLTGGSIIQRDQNGVESEYKLIRISSIATLHEAEGFIFTYCGRQHLYFTEHYQTFVSSIGPETENLGIMIPKQKNLPLSIYFQKREKHEALSEILVQFQVRKKSRTKKKFVSRTLIVCENRIVEKDKIGTKSVVYSRSLFDIFSICYEKLSNESEAPVSSPNAIFQIEFIDGKKASYSSIEASRVTSFLLDACNSLGNIGVRLTSNSINPAYRLLPNEKMITQFSTNVDSIVLNQLTAHESSQTLNSDVPPSSIRQTNRTILNKENPINSLFKDEMKSILYQRREDCESMEEDLLHRMYVCNSKNKQTGVSLDPPPSSRRGLFRTMFSSKNLIPKSSSSKKPGNSADFLSIVWEFNSNVPEIGISVSDNKRHLGKKAGKNENILHNSIFRLMQELTRVMQHKSISQLTEFESIELTDYLKCLYRILASNSGVRYFIEFVARDNTVMSIFAKLLKAKDGVLLYWLLSVVYRVLSTTYQHEDVASHNRRIFFTESEAGFLNTLMSLLDGEKGSARDFTMPNIEELPLTVLCKLLENLVVTEKSSSISGIILLHLYQHSNIFWQILVHFPALALVETCVNIIQILLNTSTQRGNLHNWQTKKPLKRILRQYYEFIVPPVNNETKSPFGGDIRLSKNPIALRLRCRYRNVFLSELYHYMVTESQSHINKNNGIQYRVFYDNCYIYKARKNKVFTGNDRKLCLLEIDSNGVIAWDKDKSKIIQIYEYRHFRQLRLLTKKKKVTKTTTKGSEVSTDEIEIGIAIEYKHETNVHWIYSSSIYNILHSLNRFAGHVGLDSDSILENQKEIENENGSIFHDNSVGTYLAKFDVVKISKKKNSHMKYTGGKNNSFLDTKNFNSMSSNSNVEFEKDRTLYFSHDSIFETDANPKINEDKFDENSDNAFIVYKRPIRDVLNIICIPESLEVFEFIYSDGSRRIYQSSERETIFAKMLDICRMEGYQSALLSIQRPAYSIALLPRMVFHSEEELQFYYKEYKGELGHFYLSKILTEGESESPSELFLNTSHFIDIIDEFNANFSVISFNETSNKIVHRAVQVMCSMLTHGASMVPMRVGDIVSIIQVFYQMNNVKMQCLENLVMIGGFLEALNRLIQQDNETVTFWCISLLQSLSYGSFGAYKHIEEKNKHEIWKLEITKSESSRPINASSKEIRPRKISSSSSVLYARMLSYTRSPMILISLTALLENLLFSGRKTTKETHYNFVLNELAWQYSTILAIIYTSDIASTVTSCTLIMKSLVDNCTPELKHVICSTALNGGMLLLHMYKGMFDLSEDQRFVSQFLTSLWMSGNSNVINLINRILPYGFIRILSDSKANDLMSKKTEDCGAIITRNIERTMDSKEAFELQSKKFNSSDYVAIKLRELLENLSGSRISKLKDQLDCHLTGESEKKFLDFRLLCQLIALDHELPDLVWGNGSRRELKASLAHALATHNTFCSSKVDRSKEKSRNLFDAASNRFRRGRLAWNHREFNVNYLGLSKEVKVSHFYVKYLLKALERPNIQTTEFDVDSISINTPEEIELSLTTIDSNPIKLFDDLFHEILYRERRIQRSDTLHACRLCLKSLHAFYKSYHPDLMKSNSSILTDVINYLSALVRRTEDPILFSEAVSFLADLSKNAHNAKKMAFWSNIELFTLLASMIHYETYFNIPSSMFHSTINNKAQNQHKKVHILGSESIRKLSCDHSNKSSIENQNMVISGTPKVIAPTENMVNSNSRVTVQNVAVVAEPPKSMGADWLKYITSSSKRRKGHARQKSDSHVLPLSNTPKNNKTDIKVTTDDLDAHMSLWKIQKKGGFVIEDAFSDFELKAMYDQGQIDCSTFIAPVSQDNEWNYLNDWKGRLQWPLFSLEHEIKYLIHETNGKKDKINMKTISKQCISILISFVLLDKTFDERDGIVRPTPKALKFISSMQLMPHIAKLVLVKDNQVRSKVSKLLTSIIEMRMTTGMKQIGIPNDAKEYESEVKNWYCQLVKTGIFFFSFTNTNVNFKDLSIFLATAVKFSVDTQSSLVKKARDHLIYDLLPVSMVNLLIDNYEEFSDVFLCNKVSSKVIWTPSMRLHLENMILEHLNDQDDENDNILSWEYVPIPPVKYFELEHDVYVYGYHLSKLCGKDNDISFDYMISVNRQFDKSCSPFFGLSSINKSDVVEVEHPEIFLQHIFTRWQQEYDRASKNLASSAPNSEMTLQKALQLFGFERSRADKLYQMESVRSRFRQLAGPVQDQPMMIKSLYDAYELLAEYHSSMSEQAMTQGSFSPEGPSIDVLVLLLETQILLYEIYGKKLENQVYQGYALLLNLFSSSFSASLNTNPNSNSNSTQNRGRILHLYALGIKLLDVTSRSSWNLDYLANAEYMAQISPNVMKTIAHKSGDDLKPDFMTAEHTMEEVFICLLNVYVEQRKVSPKISSNKSSTSSSTSTVESQRQEKVLELIIMKTLEEINRFSSIPKGVECLGRQVTSRKLDCDATTSVLKELCSIFFVLPGYYPRIWCLILKIISELSANAEMLNEIVSSGILWFALKYIIAYSPDKNQNEEVTILCINTLRVLLHHKSVLETVEHLLPSFFIQELLLKDTISNPEDLVALPSLEEEIRTPLSIWNKDMKEELQRFIHSKFDDTTEKLVNNEEVKYNFDQIAEFQYNQLANEVKIGRVFLNYYKEQQNFPLSYSLACEFTTDLLGDMFKRKTDMMEFNKEEEVSAMEDTDICCETLLLELECFLLLTQRHGHAVESCLQEQLYCNNITEFPIEMIVYFLETNSVKEELNNFVDQYRKYAYDVLYTIAEYHSEQTVSAFAYNHLLFRLVSISENVLDGYSIYILELVQILCRRSIIVSEAVLKTPVFVQILSIAIQAVDYVSDVEDEAASKLKLHSWPIVAELFYHMTSDSSSDLGILKRNTESTYSDTLIFQMKKYFPFAILEDMKHNPSIAMEIFETDANDAELVWNIETRSYLRNQLEEILESGELKNSDLLEDFEISYESIVGESQMGCDFYVDRFFEDRFQYLENPYRLRNPFYISRNLLQYWWKECRIQLDRMTIDVTDEGSGDLWRLTTVVVMILRVHVDIQRSHLKDKRFGDQLKEMFLSLLDIRVGPVLFCCLRLIHSFADSVAFRDSEFISKLFRIVQKTHFYSAFILDLIRRILQNDRSCLLSAENNVGRSVIRFVTGNNLQIHVPELAKIQAEAILQLFHSAASEETLQAKGIENAAFEREDYFIDMDQFYDPSATPAQSFII